MTQPGALLPPETGRPATRVMKARRESTCPACKGPIHVGQLIAKCGIWMHATCLIEHRHGDSTTQASG